MECGEEGSKKRGGGECLRGSPRRLESNRETPKRRQRVTGTDGTHLSGVWTHLGTHVTTLGPQLVDLRLSDVGSLLSLVQLMLDLAGLAQMSVGLFLL